MVTVGGITRLTRSGLSMTDWKLQGSLPPMNQEEWEKEFDRYKQFPEWKQRQSMTLEEFKFIYFWEYGHRMMGRGIGLAFVLPGVYFFARGKIPKSFYPRMALLFGLGGGQGLIGWWMVKSGLQMDPEQRKEIRVSPYRLATHLGMAFTTYTVLLWTALDMYNPASKMKELAKTLPEETLKFARRSRKFALHNVGLIALTVMSGAYVAGNDAGNAFNTWPKMGDNWIPDGLLQLEPKWRNMFENTALVQLDHRMLAYSTVSAVTLMYVLARKALGGAYWASLPRASRLAYNAAAAMAFTQVSLGIGTLLMYVPIPLAAAHQAGSLILLTLTTALAHSLNFSKHAPVSTTAAASATAKMATSIMVPRAHIAATMKNVAPVWKQITSDKFNKKL